MFDISENGKEAVISYLKKTFKDKRNTKTASKNFENELEKFSKKDIDVESQEKILNSIKRIGEKYKPFLEEIRDITD